MLVHMRKVIVMASTGILLASLSGQAAPLFPNGGFENPIAPSLEEDVTGKLVEGQTDENPAEGRFAYRVWSIAPTPSRRHSWRLRPTFAGGDAPVDISFMIRRNRISNPGTQFNEHGGSAPIQITLYDETDKGDALILLETSTLFLTREWRPVAVQGVQLKRGHEYAIRCRLLWQGSDELFDLDDLRVTEAAPHTVARAEARPAIRAVEFLDPFSTRAGLCSVTIANPSNQPLKGEVTLSVTRGATRTAPVKREVVAPAGQSVIVYANVKAPTDAPRRAIVLSASLAVEGQVISEMQKECPSTAAYFTTTTVNVANRTYRTRIDGDPHSSPAPLLLHREIVDALGRVAADLGYVKVAASPHEHEGRWEAVPALAGPCTLVCRLYYDDILLDKHATAVAFPGQAQPLAKRAATRPLPFRLVQDWAVAIDAPHDVALVDLRGEGLDAVVAHYFADKVTAFSGKDRSVLWTFKTHSHADRIKLADLSGDGHPELLISDFVRPGTPVGTLFALRRDGKLYWEVPLRGPGHGVAAADFNGDGRPEVVVGTCFTQMHCFTADGAPIWLRWVAQHRWGSVDVLDAGRLSPDEPPSIVGMAWMAGHVRFFCFDRNGGIRWTRAVGRNASAPYASAMALADLTGDGHNEIIATIARAVNDKDIHDEDRLWVFKGDGTVLWTRAVPELPGCSRAGLKVMDIDGDGRPEILSIVRPVAQPGRYFLDIYRHNGELVFCQEFTIEGPSAGYNWNGWQVDAALQPDGSVTVLFGASSESKLVGLRLERTDR